MDLDFLSDEREQKEANRTALLLAKARYDQILAPFVKNSEVRFAFVKDEIGRIAQECAEETGADSNYVDLMLRKVLADVVIPVTEPEHEDFPDSEEKKGLPPEGEGPEYEPDAETSVLDHGAVLVENEDVKEISPEKMGCFRCEAELETEELVCQDCEAELREAASMYGEPAVQDNVSPQDPNAIMQCDICKNFTGTYDQVAEHLRTAHAQDLLNYQPQAAVESPAELFDQTIEELANRAAARQYSLPDPDEIRLIASRYRIDFEDVKKNLKVVAEFGPYTAVNGKFVAEDADGVYGLENYVEIDMSGVGGRVPAHEALVPINAAIKKVSEEMNLSENNVYDAVREYYGADLASKYHASVDGRHSFYLPSSLLNSSTKDKGKFTLRDVQEHERKQRQRAERGIS